MPIVFDSGKINLKNHFKLTKEVSKIVDDIALVNANKMFKLYKFEFQNILKT